jgi:hypothetical protein
VNFLLDASLRGPQRFCTTISEQVGNKEGKRTTNEARWLLIYRGQAAVFSFWVGDRVRRWPMRYARLAIRVYLLRAVEQALTRAA